MPPVRSARNRKPPPDGFDDIEDTLLEFSNKMKDAENASHEGKKRHEVMWPIFQISHQRTYALRPSRTITDGSRYRVKIYLRPLLRERGYLETAIRLASQEWLRRCKFDSKMEEAGLREGMARPWSDRKCRLLILTII